MKTVLVGQFRGGVMVEARPAKIIAERCNDGIKEIKVSTPKRYVPSFSFERNSRLRVYEPTVMDPYEKKFVYVNTTERGDDGLFAKKDIEANQVVAYYAGTYWHPNESITHEVMIGGNQTGYEV